LSVKLIKSHNPHLNQLSKKNKSNNLKSIKNLRLELKRKSKLLESYLIDLYTLEKAKRSLKILTLPIKTHQIIQLLMLSDHLNVTELALRNLMIMILLITNSLLLPTHLDTHRRILHQNGKDTIKLWNHQFLVNTSIQMMLIQEN